MVLMTVLLTKTQILVEFAIVLFNMSAPNNVPKARDTSLTDHVKLNTTTIIEKRVIIFVTKWVCDHADRELRL